MGPKRRSRKATKKPVSDKNSYDEDEVLIPLENEDEPFNDQEVERQSAAIRALRDVEIEQFQSMLRLLRSNFNKDQLQVPVLQFFKDNLSNLVTVNTGEDGQYEVKWKDKDLNSNLNHVDERTLHASLLHRLSIAYPSAGIPSMGGFEFSNKSVKTSLFGADKLQIRSLVLEEPTDSQIELKDGLQTPNRLRGSRAIDKAETSYKFNLVEQFLLNVTNVNNSRLSIGLTPKTLRLPRCGEMLLSVRGSPLGVYAEDNMETIKETEDG